MLLSRLAYNCVSRAVGNDGHSMSYVEFTQGQAGSDPYLSGAFSRVFPEINAFMARLSSIERIKAATSSLTVSRDADSIRFTDMLANAGLPDCSVSRILSVYQTDKLGRRWFLAWTVKGNSVSIDSPFDRQTKVSVQFRVTLPQFDEDDIKEVSFDEANAKWKDYLGNEYQTKREADKNVDLLGYGVSDEACSLCMDYFDAVYNRDVDPQAANALMIQTESRLEGLPVLETIETPDRVARILR